MAAPTPGSKRGSRSTVTRRRQGHRRRGVHHRPPGGGPRERRVDRRRDDGVDRPRVGARDGHRRVPRRRSGRDARAPIPGVARRAMGLPFDSERVSPFRALTNRSAIRSHTRTLRVLGTLTRASSRSHTRNLRFLGTLTRRGASRSHLAGTEFLRTHRKSLISETSERVAF